MSGTYTLAEIHERHERLERLAADISQVAADPSLLKLISDEPRAGVSDRFMDLVNAHLSGFVADTMNVMAEKLADERAQLKHDATAAYVAFMGGE